MKTPTEAMMRNARATVLGVITARVNDNTDDAAMLLNCFLNESFADGYELSQSWAQLFSASVMITVPLISCRSVHHDQNIDTTLAEFALMLAEIGQSRE